MCKSVIADVQGVLGCWVSNGLETSHSRSVGELGDSFADLLNTENYRLPHDRFVQTLFVMHEGSLPQNNDYAYELSAACTSSRRGNSNAMDHFARNIPSLP